MTSIPGEITFSERNGATVATVRFPSIDVEFFVAAAAPADLKRSIMGMVRDCEMVRGILDRTGCLDWDAMEQACKP